MTETVTTTAAPPRRLPRFLLPLMLALSLGTLAVSLLLAFAGGGRKPKVEETSNPVPDFTLTERSGATVTNADLRGKVWVASFVFTRCGGPCPRVTANMHQLADDLKLAETPDLRLVTFTMDPKYDTPEVLRRYATQVARTDSDRWLFLTGDEDEIHRVMRDGFKLYVERNPAPESGKEFNHHTYLVAVDKKGLIRGHFSGIVGEHDEGGEQFKDSSGRLRETVRALLKE